MISPVIAKRLYLPLILSFILSGCAELDTPPVNINDQTPDAYTSSNVDKLLDFGASMSEMSQASKSDLCKSLLSTQGLLYSDDIQLQLMVGRLLSDDCGNIPKLLEGIQAINPIYRSDERLQKLIAIDTQVLLRIHNQSKKIAATKQKSKKLKPAQESKESVSETNPNETHLLREKLEAIRSLEKKMDESSEGN